MKKVLLIALLSLVACGAPKHTSLQKAQAYIHYYKDARTGICYAGHNLSSYSATFTTVPCSIEVEHLLEPLPEYFDD